MLRAASFQRSSSPYFENNYGSNRNRSSSSSPYHRSANRNSNSNSNSTNSADFIYQGRNKQQWATLQSKIRTRLATQNILYLEDELEMTRRTTPPAPAVTLHAPAHYLESIAERDDRIRQQKLNDDDFKKRDTKFDEYKDKLAIDYPKATAAHYHYLSRAIITDLDRWIENLSPATSDVAIQYRAMVKRLLDRWGPTSEKDAEESRRKFASIAVDTFGADVFLAAADTIVDNLAKTLVRDTANNPVMEPVPLRPHLPRPPWHSSRTDLAAYIQADEAAQAAWELQHPANRPMNHRPTDNAIKNTIIIALSQSSFTAYSSLAQRYQQVDHATKTWPELRQDIESLIHNNPKGTSREPHLLPRIANPRPSTSDWTNRRTPHSAPTDSRSARSTHPDYYDDRCPSPTYSRNDHYQQEHPNHLNNDSRSATTTSIPSALTPQRYPCANCGADHKSMDCDSLKCSTCQATFPTAALRQAHYLAHHKRDNPSKRTRFASPNHNRSQQTPPSSPFLSRSARSMDDMTAQSPYDSGYDSSYSTASGPGNPPPPTSDYYPDVADQADQMIYNAFVAQIVPTSNNNPPPAQPTLQRSGDPPAPDATHPRQPDFTYYLDDIIEYSRTPPFLHHTNLIERLLRHHPNLAAPSHIRYRHGHQPVLLHNPPPADSDSDELPDLAADSDSDELPDLIDISDDERNRLDRDRPTPRITFPPPGTYDIRVVTHSDDQQTDSDDEPDNAPHDPATWYDPTLPNLPFHDRNMMLPWHTPPFLSQIEIHQWYRSQMRWRPFIQTLPERHQEAYYRRPSPDLRLTEPNRPYMLAPPIAHTGQSIDPMDIRARLQHFDSQVPQLTWSNYLRTLHPPIARHYRSFPPLHGDSIANQHHHAQPAWPAPITQPRQPPAAQPQPHVDTSRHQPTPDTIAQDSSLKDPAVPHPNDTSTPSTWTNPNPPLSHPHVAGRWHYGSSHRKSANSTPPSPPAQKGTRPEGYHTREREPSPPYQRKTRPEGYRNAVPRQTSPPTQKGHHFHTAPPMKARFSSNRAPPGQPEATTSHIITTTARPGGYLNDPNTSQPSSTEQHGRGPLLRNLEPHAQAALIKTWQAVIPMLPTDSSPLPYQHHSRHSTQPQPHTSSHRRPTSRSHGTHTDRAPASKRHRPTADQPHPSDHSEPPSEEDNRPWVEPTSDVEGEPWCDCCTAQLSDGDISPALIDLPTSHIRYRIRQETDRPSHSNQHLDYIRLFRDNAEYHARQRRTWENKQAREGSQGWPHDQLHRSTFENTNAVSTLSDTISQLQFARYQRRGGRLLHRDHGSDHRFNSPNNRNTAPGQPYRTWFHQIVSNQYYSLGEATRHYTQWLNDPIYGPERDRSQQNPYLPRARLEQQPTSPTPPLDYDSDPESDQSQSTLPLPHSKQPPDIRSQTIVENVHLSPDDPNAVIDSGAMMTTSPRRLLMGTIWQDNIRPAPQGTSIRYGNMETEPVEEMASIGSYQASIVPDRFSTALVCVHDIVAAGHNVTFTDYESIVVDVGGAYILHIPRNPASREWRAPLHLLQRLTDLRAAHPLRQLQPLHQPPN